MLVFVIWPQKPIMKVISIVPDKLDPMSVTESEAWTNWDVQANLFNQNIFPFNAEKADLTLYFKNFPKHPAAYCTCELISVGPRSNGTVHMKMKVPLYSSESGIPNLIGECFTKKTVGTLIKMKLLVGINKRVKLLLESEFTEDLECG